MKRIIPIPCNRCDGKGRYFYCDNCTFERKQCERCQFKNLSIKCPYCDGKGFTWKYIALALFFLFGIYNADVKAEVTDAIKVIDYIVANNEELQALQNLSGLNYKVTMRASGNSGVLGSQTDRATVGLNLEIPLIDVRERKEWRHNIAQKKATITKEVINAITNLNRLISEVNKLKGELGYESEILQWYKERVKVGYEYQKTYLDKEQSFKRLQGEIAVKKAECITEEARLIGLVTVTKRAELKQMLKQYGFSCE